MLQSNRSGEESLALCSPNIRMAGIYGLMQTLKVIDYAVLFAAPTEKADEQQRETTSFEYEYYIKKLIKNDKITACIKKLSVGRG